MFDGIHLTLLIGPLAVPLPAPLPLVEALSSVQVTSGRDRTGFQLKFSVGKLSLIQMALLPSGFFDPMITRVVIIVTHRGLPQVIADGVVTRQEVSPSNEPAGNSSMNSLTNVFAKSAAPLGSGDSYNTSSNRELPDVLTARLRAIFRINSSFFGCRCHVSIRHPVAGWSWSFSLSITCSNRDSLWRSLTCVSI